MTARTYALATRKTTGLFDQYPDTRSQVYRGVTGESVRRTPPCARPPGACSPTAASRAVTYYFSTSGGHTENVEFSFVGSLSKPWLVGRAGSLRQPVALPPLEGADHCGRALDSALGAPGAFKQVKVLERGVVAAGGARPRGRHGRLDGRNRAADPRARSGCATPGSPSSRESSRRAARARRDRRAWGARLTRPALVGRFAPAPRKQRADRGAPRQRAGRGLEGPPTSGPHPHVGGPAAMREPGPWPDRPYA